MFRPYKWAIFRLRFNLQISYTRCVERFVWGLGGWVGGGVTHLTCVHKQLEKIYL